MVDLSHSHFPRISAKCGGVGHTVASGVPPSGEDYQNPRLTLGSSPFFATTLFLRSRI